MRSWCPCAVSMTSTSMPAASSAFAFVSTSPLIPIGGGHPQLAGGVERGVVERGAQGALCG